MAAAALTLTKSISDFTSKFTGINTVRWNSDKGALADTADTWWELPVLADKFAFSMGDPSITEYKICGSQIPWDVSAESGTNEVTVVVPALDSFMMALGFKATSSISTTITETTAQHPSGKAGSWSFAGYELKMKRVTGMLWLIDESTNMSIMIKNFSGYATLVLDDTKAPVGIQFKGSFAKPEDGDTDGDVLIGTYTPTV